LPFVGYSSIGALFFDICLEFDLESIERDLHMSFIKSYSIYLIKVLVKFKTLFNEGFLHESIMDVKWKEVLSFSLYGYFFFLVFFLED